MRKVFEFVFVMAIFGWLVEGLKRPSYFDVDEASPLYIKIYYYAQFLPFLVCFLREVWLDINNSDSDSDPRI